MAGDSCSLIQGKLKPKHFKDSTGSNSRPDHEELLSPCTNNDVVLDQNEGPSLEEGLYANDTLSPPTAEETSDDERAVCTSLVSRPRWHRHSHKRRSKDSDVESFNQYHAEENTYGAGNAFGEGIFLNSVGLA